MTKAPLPGGTFDFLSEPEIAEYDFEEKYDFENEEMDIGDLPDQAKRDKNRKDKEKPKVCDLCDIEFSTGKLLN